jgi:hypothetical protein
VWTVPLTCNFVIFDMAGLHVGRMAEGYTRPPTVSMLLMIIL